MCVQKQKNQVINMSEEDSSPWYFQNFTWSLPIIMSECVLSSCLKLVRPKSAEPWKCIGKTNAVNN